MPESLIRLRPTIASVEWRRINTVTSQECIEAAFGDEGGTQTNPLEEFATEWAQRHAKRGPVFAFDKAWGWFYLLMKAK